MLSDYLTHPGSQDRSYFDVTEPQEASYSVDALSVTEQEPRVAVAEVGWLLDRALTETLPPSDPISPSVPGESVP